MRPGVYASVMRNRKTNVRRVHTGRHQYSWRGFFIALFIGLFLFVPGLIVTIIGLEAKDVNDLPEDSVKSTGYSHIVNDRLYKLIGPAALIFGIFLICSAGIYYSCWGFRSTVRRPSNHKHKKTTHHTEQHDPLQPNIYKTTCTCKKHPKAVPTISTTNHVTSYSSVRSKGSPTHTTNFVEELDRINSNAMTSPDIRSCRHGQHYPTHHVHPTSPKPYRGDGVSHRSTSRHRSSSQSPRRAHAHPHHHTCNHHHSSTPPPDNQVTFVNTDAPLAEGESCSMDISIDLSTEVPTKGLKY